jgi:hypothetical protein
MSCANSVCSTKMSFDTLVTFNKWGRSKFPSHKTQPNNLIPSINYKNMVQRPCTRSLAFPRRAFFSKKYRITNHIDIWLVEHLLSSDMVYSWTKIPEQSRFNELYHCHTLIRQKIRYHTYFLIVKQTKWNVNYYDSQSNQMAISCAPTEIYLYKERLTL